MAIAQRIAAATAILTGFAFGLAAPAGAQYQLNGHYTETQSDPNTGQPLTFNGQPLINNLYFTPCGDGCASVTFQPGGTPAAQAQVVNGMWTFDSVGNDDCSDGTSVPNAIILHRTFDPTTLAGTVQNTQKLPGCGTPVGNTWSFNIQLTQAP